MATKISLKIGNKSGLDKVLKIIDSELKNQQRSLYRARKATLEKARSLSAKKIQEELNLLQSSIKTEIKADAGNFTEEKSRLFALKKGIKMQKYRGRKALKGGGVSVQIKNKVAKSYLIWGGVFTAILLAISLIWVFLAALNLDA
jgi:hypothetical protein